MAESTKTAPTSDLTYNSIGMTQNATCFITSSVNQSNTVYIYRSIHLSIHPSIHPFIQLFLFYPDQSVAHLTLLDDFNTVILNRFSCWWYILMSVHAWKIKQTNNKLILFKILIFFSKRYRKGKVKNWIWWCIITPPKVVRKYVIFLLTTHMYVCKQVVVL